MQNKMDGERAGERNLIEKEKRSAARKATCSRFVVNIDSATIEGAGSNISQTGAYFVTCDEIPVEVVIEDEGREHRVQGRITRIDTVSKGSQGVAIQFERRLLEYE
ncbi:MAG: PilZ domain-containing protein [Planctomycetota bacterium]|jgi:hypothetical protein